MHILLDGFPICLEEMDNESIWPWALSGSISARSCLIYFLVTGAISYWLIASWILLGIKSMMLCCICPHGKFYSVYISLKWLWASSFTLVKYFMDCPWTCISETYLNWYLSFTCLWKKVVFRSPACNQRILDSFLQYYSSTRQDEWR
jgi:hypothetical protein